MVICQMMACHVVRRSQLVPIRIVSHGLRPVSVGTTHFKRCFISCCRIRTPSGNSNQPNHAMNHHRIVLTPLKHNSSPDPLITRGMVGNIKKEKSKKGGKPKVKLSDEELNQVIDVEELRIRVKGVVDSLRNDLIKTLNIRAGVGVEDLEVEFDKEKYPLKELASISRKGSHLMVLNMTSLPDAIKPVMDAITSSGMNVNPQQEATVIYLQLPKITREHRESLAKSAKVLFQKSKEELQKIQNSYVREVKMKSDLKGSSGTSISADLAFAATENIRFLTEAAISECNSLMEAKIKELLG